MNVSLYEILFSVDGTLMTTTSDCDHSQFCDVWESELRVFTKEDAKALVDYLKAEFLSEPTHIEVSFEYRDGMHEYTEIAHYPINESIPYDELSDELIHALFIFGDGIDAGEIEMELAKEAEAQCNPGWYWGGERLLRLHWRKVVKE